MNLRKRCRQLLISGLLLSALSIPLCTAEAAEIINKETSQPVMTEAVWKNSEIKDSIEGVLSPYFTGETPIKHKKGKNPKIKDIPYVIVDLDEAAGINQAQDCIALYQVQHLAFAIPPEHLKAVLQTGMTLEMLHQTYGADDGNGRELLLSDVLNDVVVAYKKLWDKKLVSGAGKIISDGDKTDDYYEFTTKMMWLYHAINATQGAEVAKPWVGYWLTGMTPYEAYSLSLHAVEMYGDYVEEPTEKKKAGSFVKKKKSVAKPVFNEELVLSSRIRAEGNVGIVTVKCRQGIHSSKQVSQLVQAAQISGLDVWFVSAANYETVRATMNYYHVPGSDGILSLRTNVNKSGKYVNQYNDKYNPMPYGQGKIKAVGEMINEYYKMKEPVLLATDAADDTLQIAYPGSHLLVTFENGDAVKAVEGITKKGKKSKGSKKNIASGDFAEAEQTETKPVEETEL